RLDAKKESPKETPRESAPVLAAPILATPSSDATLVLPETLSDDQLQNADPLPTDLPLDQNVLGDLSGPLTIDGAHSAGELAQPILGDPIGADEGSRDPGTDIFGNPTSDEEEV